jgi:signal transduction histidine kinase
MIDLVSGFHGSVMPRIKQLTSANTIVDEIVRKIRNPLNALLLNIDNLEDEIAEVDIETSRERLRRMRNAIAELDSLLCEVLRLSELPKPRITVIDVNALVRDVETFAKPELSKKELIVRSNLQDNLPRIQGDPIQIKQAILNILLNAIESSPSRGSIILATEAKNSNVSIKVEDNGEGIQLAHRNRIFDPFFSTKEGGIGLGLALASEIIRLHHGQISFTSEVGKGSSFIISLPFRR